MKIAFLTRATTGGGAERQLMLLAGGLAARGHEVSVLAFYGPSATVDRLRVIGLAKRGRWDMLGFFGRLVGALRADRPDILHSYLPAANALAALAKPLVPALKVVFGIRAAGMDLARYDWGVRLVYRLERALLGAADLVISNSAAASRLYPEAQPLVIYNGIDTDRFRADRAAGQRLRAEHGIAADMSVIGVVGRFDPMKDHDTFFAALARLAPTRAGLRAIVVGGPKTARVRLCESAGRHGVADRVVWLDPRDDLRAVYGALDLLCLSSAYGESFPNVVAEAMACGVPCVATDLGEVRALIGTAGRVVPPRNAAALADALAYVLDLPAVEREAMGRRARAHIESRFNVKRLVDETEQALQSLLRSA